MCLLAQVSTKLFAKLTIGLLPEVALETPRSSRPASGSAHGAALVWDERYNDSATPADSTTKYTSTYASNDCTCWGSRRYLYVCLSKIT